MDFAKIVFGLCSFLLIPSLALVLAIRFFLTHFGTFIIGKCGDELKSTIGIDKLLLLFPEIAPTGKLKNRMKELNVKNGELDKFVKFVAIYRWLWLVFLLCFAAVLIFFEKAV